MVLDYGLGAIVLVRGLDVAEAARHRHHVHGSVTAADHYHLFRGVFHAAFVEGGEEGHAGDAVRGVAAGDAQGAALLCADGQQDSVIVLFQLFEADVTADAGVHARLDTHVEDAPHLAVHDVARHAVAGDAVACHASQLGALVEHRGAMPEPAQLVGGCHAGDAAADDGDLLAGLPGGLIKAQAVLQGAVADVLFHRVDADKVLDLVAVAAFLAGRGADAAHDGRERVGIGGAPEGVFLPWHPGRWLLDAAYDLQPAADVLAGRAAALAGRRAVHVGRTLVGGILVEDVIRPAGVAVIVVFVTAEREFFFHQGCSREQFWPANLTAIVGVYK